MSLNSIRSTVLTDKEFLDLHNKGTPIRNSEEFYLFLNENENIRDILGEEKISKLSRVFGITSFDLRSNGEKLLLLCRKIRVYINYFDQSNVSHYLYGIPLQLKENDAVIICPEIKHPSFHQCSKIQNFKFLFTDYHVGDSCSVNEVIKKFLTKHQQIVVGDYKLYCDRKDEYERNCQDNFPYYSFSKIRFLEIRVFNPNDIMFRSAINSPRNNF